MLDLNQKTHYDHLTYKELVSIYKKCNSCKLSTHRNKVVVGSGKVPSSIMIIGEGPGAQEDLMGKPFVGRSGQLLTNKYIWNQIFDTDGEIAKFHENTYSKC